MTEQDFLSILETSLSGELPSHEVRSNVQYYRDYIDSKKRVKSEAEVMQELGDPRLIARTIVDTYQLSHPSKRYEDVNSSTRTGQYQEGEVHQESTGYGDKMFNRKPLSQRKLKVIGWAIGIGFILTLLLILGTVFWLGAVVLRLFIKFLLPILLIVIGVTWIGNQIRRH